MVGRLLGWALVLLGLIAVGYDALAYFQTGTLSLIELGRAWYAIDPGSINLVQAVVERYIHPFLWNDVIFPVLLAPASAVLIGLGLVLILVFRKRRKYR